jgi:ectoine hydroxylase-related dioxygenase (phytanoyl-CoA dioxygenase family)
MQGAAVILGTDMTVRTLSVQELGYRHSKGMSAHPDARPQTDIANRTQGTLGMSFVSDQDVAQFRDQGYFVTRPAFDRAALDAVASEFERLWAEDIRAAEATGDAKSIEMARLRAFIGQAHTKSDVLADFVKSGIYLEACAKLVGADADLYYNQCVIKAPEKGHPFGWHQDSGYTTTIPLEYITCWTAIRPTTLENGCIWLIPGSHKNGVLPHHATDQRSTDADDVDESGAIPVEMDAGQVAIFSSLLLHKSGPNRSKSARFGYVPQYHVPNVVIAATGEKFGDQYPVLRNGKQV